MTTPPVITDSLSTARARLPVAYQTAKTLLAQCSKIDECKDWADKAEALASYARQAKDDSLRKHADRIQARAIRRAGELLKEFDGRDGRNLPKKEGNHPFSSPTQTKAAEEAGMSEYQQKTAVRVANVPEEEFEDAVDSDNPPTVTRLAEEGKKSRPKSDKPGLGGPVPAGFGEATHFLGTVSRFAEFCQEKQAEIIAGGLLPHEITTLKQNIAIIDAWLDELLEILPRGRRNK